MTRLLFGKASTPFMRWTIGTIAAFAVPVLFFSLAVWTGPLHLSDELAAQGGIIAGWVGLGVFIGALAAL